MHSYNQSTYQAFYYVDDIEDLYGEPLTSADWILSFTSDGSTCVGMRQWDDSDGAKNDIPAMGYDGQEYSEGYLEIDEEPTFKLFDESEKR